MNQPDNRRGPIRCIVFSIGFLLWSPPLLAQLPHSSLREPGNENKAAAARLFPAMDACLEAKSALEQKKVCSEAKKTALRVLSLLRENTQGSSFYISDCGRVGADETSGRCAQKNRLIQRLGQFVQRLDTVGNEPADAAGGTHRKFDIRALARKFAALHAAHTAEMSVVLRGGLSLGNYQAGFLYYISEFLKARNERFRSRAEGSPRRGFATVTGASAGGLNAVISSIDSCLRPQPHPERSMYYKGWTHVGLFGRHGRAGLVVDGRASENSLGIFSKRPITNAANMVFSQAVNTSDFKRNCPALNLGITVTRLAPDRFSLYSKNDELKAKDGSGLQTVLGASKQAEKMLFRIEFEKDPGKLEPRDSVVRLTPLRPFIPFEEGSGGSDPRAAVRQFYLAYGSGFDPNESLEEQKLNLADLAPVLYATAAFPVAFAPEELTYARVGRNGRPKKEESARFVDGGIFDNTPLGLAITIDRWEDARAAEAGYRAQGLENRATEAAWLDSHEGSCLVSRSDPLEQLLCDVLPPQPRDYLFIEPTVVDWEDQIQRLDRNARAAEEKQDAILSTVAKFAGSFLGTSMGASLVATAQANPFITEQAGDTILPRLLVPERHVPIASRRLENFMGFFERDFREFDFYVGLLDAERFIENDAVYGALDVAPPIVSSRYQCMRDYYQLSENVPSFISEGDLPRSCFALEPEAERRRLDSLEHLDALTEEVIQRMDEDWTKSEGESRRQLLQSAQRRLAGQNFRAMIVAMHNYKGWMISQEYDREEEFAKFFEVLEGAGFTFVDMQRIRIARWIQITTGAKARLVVRDLMQKGVIQLAKAQPEFTERVKVRFLGGIGADLYEPRPTWAQVSLGLNFNGIESYFGWYLGDWRKFRLDLGGRLYQFGPRNYTDLDGKEHRLFAADAAAFTRLSFAVAEGSFARLEFGIGFIGSELFAFGEPRDRTQVAFRYGPELTGSISLLRHFYVDTQLDFFIDGCGRQFPIPESHCLMNHAGHPQGEEVRIFNKDWRFTLGAGWRWNL